MSHSIAVVTVGSSMTVTRADMLQGLGVRRLVSQ
jgi:hypothetical protein